MNTGDVVGRLVDAVGIRAVAKGARAYPWFVRSWRQYASLPGAEPLRLADAYPQLRDRTLTTPYDPHYFHQAVWTMERLAGRQPSMHVDVGSDVTFVGMASALTQVTFVDIRPLPVELPRLHPVAGDVAGGLPFEMASVESLSCLHVVEHVGLGRYGDALDPLGTQKAVRELARVIAPNGDLYLSLPVGRPRVCFNAHRIHAPRHVIEMLSSLELVEFSVVDDAYRRVDDADPDEAAALDYGCGLFHFRGPAR
jgi:SAM-dependent methyltransferase